MAEANQTTVTLLRPIRNSWQRTAVVTLRRCKDKTLTKHPSTVAVAPQQVHLNRSRPGDPAFELPKLPQLRVSASSRTLRRADTELQALNGFARTIQTRQLEPILSEASHPPLHKTQGRGTHSFRTGKKNGP